MNRPIRLRHLILAGIAAVATTAATAGPVGAGPDGPEVPPRLTVPAGNKVFLVGHATGVQIYSCNGVGWSFVAPRADLRDNDGHLIATHFAGPTWQARDGSAVIAKRVDGVVVDPTAIPWLLLSKDAISAGPEGDRLMSTTFIQRTATTGGLAPAADECTAATAGATAEVPYTADYYFWKSTGG